MIKYISIIVTLLVLIYMYISREEPTNKSKQLDTKLSSAQSIVNDKKPMNISTENNHIDKKKHITNQDTSNQNIKSELNEFEYKNVFAYFKDNGIKIPRDENDILLFMETTLKETKDYHNFIQALLDDFALLSPEDYNDYSFTGYFIAMESDIVEKEIFDTLENTNEALEKEKWSALLASIELRTKEGRDKVTSLLNSTDDYILKSNYISSLANSVVKTENEKEEIHKVLSPYLYDKNPILRAAALNRSFQWNDLMKNTKPIEDALSSQNPAIKNAALFSISQTEKVPLKLKDSVFSIMNNDEIDYGVRVQALDTLANFRDKLTEDEMNIVREFGKEFEERTSSFENEN